VPWGLERVSRETRERKGREKCTAPGGLVRKENGTNLLGQPSKISSSWGAVPTATRTRKGRKEIFSLRLLKELWGEKREKKRKGGVLPLRSSGIASSVGRMRERIASREDEGTSKKP